MAGLASLLLQGLVHDLLFIGVLFMARIARLVALGLEEIFCGGSMRIMAGNAFPPLHGSVDVGLVHADFAAAVAGVAKVVAVFFQEEARDHPVAKMAVLAIFFLHAGMQVFQSHIRITEFLMTVQTILACKAPKLRQAVIGDQEQTA